MDTRKIKNFYLQYSRFTFPGKYEEELKKLPDSIEEIGKLIRKSFIHRSTLASGNTGSNKDLRFGDMSKIPWYQQPEDDYFPTTGSMLVELFRRDSRGFIFDRSTENKPILTCRFLAILFASALKAKGIPARVRSGFASYFDDDTSTSWDHWVTEYIDPQSKEWILVDIDGSLSMVDPKINPYNMSKDQFNYSADVWVNVRDGKLPERRFWNAMPYSGLNAIAWELFYDFHCLMNNEIIYLHHPANLDINKFYLLSKKQVDEIDNLANLMVFPDKNFNEIEKIWNKNKDFRLLTGALL